MKSFILGLCLILEFATLVIFSGTLNARNIDREHLIFELLPTFELCPYAVLIEEDEDKSWKLWCEVHEKNKTSRILDYKDLSFLFDNVTKKEQEIILQQLKMLNNLETFWDKESYEYSQANWPQEPSYIAKISELLKSRLQEITSTVEAHLPENRNAWVRHAYSILFMMNSYYGAFFNTSLNAVHKLQDNGSLPERNSPESNTIGFSSLQQAWVHNFGLGFNARNFKYLENKPIFSAIGIGIELLINKANYKQWQKSKEAAYWASYWKFVDLFSELELIAMHAIEENINKFSPSVSQEVLLKLAFRVSEKVVLLGTLIDLNKHMTRVYYDSLEKLEGTIVKLDLEDFAEQWSQLKSDGFARMKNDAKILFEPLIYELDRIAAKIATLEK